MSTVDDQPAAVGGVLIVVGSDGVRADELVRDALAGCGLDPVEVRVAHACPRCGSSAHGRPFLVGLDPAPYVSVSRTGDLTVVALARVPVGIDVEAAEREPPREMVLHSAESGDALRSWVRKEAVLKATGEGLVADPSTLLIVGGRVRRGALTVLIRDVECDGHVMALAVVGDTWPEVTMTAAGQAPPDRRA